MNEFIDLSNKNNFKIAVITDVHGNLEALTSVIKDIKKREVDKVISLGDNIGLGVNSKECVDLLISNNVDSVVGNHELYLLKGCSIDENMSEDEVEHHKWIENSLTQKEIDYIASLPLKYEYSITYKDSSTRKIIFEHYLINDEKLAYPYEVTKLNEDINLWIKHNSEDDFHVIGHLHERFDENEVDGISEDFIEETGELANIYVVPSLGCTKDNITKYLLIEIVKGGLSFKLIDIKFDREKLENKLKTTDFPDKDNILKYFYEIYE